MSKSKVVQSKKESVFAKNRLVVSPPVKNEKKETHQAPSVIVEKFLTDRFDFRINSVLNKVEYRLRGESAFCILDEFNYNSINRLILTNGLSCSIQMLRTLLYSDYVIKYNPFVEYFTNLPKWDGVTDYIGAIAKTVSTNDEDFWQLCFKRWFVALLACSIEPKVINHTVIVFSGKQGIGKTTWLRNLIPLELDQYVYSGSINPDNKDTLIQISECILINLDELESLNRSELGSVKELITKDAIRIRRAYGRDSENYVRRASFAGSVNKKEFLSDTTGNRRFLCFEVDKIDYSKKLDLIGAYSQAYSLFNSGFKYWFSPDEVDLINKSNEQFRMASLEEEWLLENFEPCEVVDAQEIKSTMELIKMMSIDQKVFNPDSSGKKLGMALKAYGFKSFKKNQRKVYALKRSSYPIFGVTTSDTDSV